MNRLDLDKDVPLEVLLIEDDDVDAEAVLRAFHQHQVSYRTLVVKNGVEALAILRATDGERKISQPYIILLDINLPQMNGMEFLTVLRNDPRLKCSIVFILTTSDDIKDRLAAYERWVAGYILKSRSGMDFGYLISLLKSYEKIVEFPPEIVN